MKIDIVVTRHAALVAYLIEVGLTTAETPVISHVTAPGEIAGRHVAGVIPLSLAAECETVTEIPLALTPAMRGRELSLEDLRAVAGRPRTYTVRTRD